MASEKQISANQANSKRSSGPRTHQGKARASRNALKHGVLSKSLVVFSEEQQEFDDLLTNLIEAHDPFNQSEMMLVEKMAIALWKQKRLITAESAQITHQQINSHPTRLPADPEKQTEAILRAVEAQSLPQGAERYVRYDTLLERQYYAAMTMLQRVQSTRARETERVIEQDSDR
jgi:hypothetical protein